MRAVTIVLRGPRPAFGTVPAKIQAWQKGIPIEFLGISPYPKNADAFVRLI
jgi:hypothetical protein